MQLGEVWKVRWVHQAVLCSMPDKQSLQSLLSGRPLLCKATHNLQPPAGVELDELEVTAVTDVQCAPWRGQLVCQPAGYTSACLEQGELLGAETV